MGVILHSLLELIILELYKSCFSTLFSFSLNVQSLVAYAENAYT